MKDSFILPSDISEFSELDIFKKVDDPDHKSLVISDKPFVMGCELTNDELTVLSLSPKYALLEDLKVDDFRYQLGLTKAKMRYELKGHNPQEDDKPSVEDYHLEKASRDRDNEDRLTYDPTESSVTMTNVRVTEFPGNARDSLPGAIHPSLEAGLKIRTEQLGR